MWWEALRRMRYCHFFFFLTDVRKTAAKSLDIISFQNSQWSSWCIPQPITRGQWPHFAVIFLSQSEGYCSLHHLQCDLESIGSLTLVVKSSWCLITTFRSGRASPASKREVAAFRENCFWQQKCHFSACRPLFFIVFVIFYSCYWLPA